MSGQDVTVTGDAGGRQGKPVITFFDEAGETGRVQQNGGPRGNFAGLATYADGTTCKIVVQMTTESRTGDIAGTVLVNNGCRGDDSHLYVFRGTSRRRTFNLQALATGNRVALLTGSVSPDGLKVTGTFTATEPGRPISSGTFDVNRS